MNAEFRLARPDDADATMTITMEIRQWRRIRAAIENTKTYHSDAQEFSYLVRDLVDKATAEFDAVESREVK